MVPCNTKVFKNNFILTWNHGLTRSCFSLPKSTTQTASQPVQPFLQGSQLWQTNRPRYSVCNNRLHLRT